MKKLLAILVLGLLISTNVFAEKIILFNCYPKSLEPKTAGITDHRIEIDKNNNFLLQIMEKDKTWVENKNKEIKKKGPNYNYRHKLKQTFKYQIISNEDKVVIARDALSELSKEEVEALYEIKDSFIGELRVNLNKNILYFESYYLNPPHYRSSSTKPAFCKKNKRK